MKNVEIIIVDNNLTNGNILSEFLKEFLELKDTSFNFDVFFSADLALNFLNKLDENILSIIIFTKFTIIGKQGTSTIEELYDRLQPFKNLGVSTFYFSSTLTYNENSSAFMKAFDYYGEELEPNSNENLVREVKKVISSRK